MHYEFKKNMLQHAIQILHTSDPKDPSDCTARGTGRGARGRSLVGSGGCPVEVSRAGAPADVFFNYSFIDCQLLAVNY